MIREKTKRGRLSAKTMNNIYNDLLAYISTSLLLAISVSLFGDASDKR